MNFFYSKRVFKSVQNYLNKSVPCACLTFVTSNSTSAQAPAGTVMTEETFYYFGYGSNMLAQRIHIQNPTAKRLGVGKLTDYRLDFFSHSKAWMGPPATIVPHLGAYVYGAVWEINSSNTKDLDNQEGVDKGLYAPLTVPVLGVETGQEYECRVYHLVKQPEGDLRSMLPEQVPYERMPSKSYLKTLVKGAVETGVPEDYVQWLRTVRHNSKMVELLEKRLELQQVKL